MRPAMPAQAQGTPPPQAGGVMRPAMPAQAQGQPVVAMKKGGFVPFAKAKAGDAKGGEKKLPPWLEKGKDKKFADGGMVRRGYGKARGA